MDTFKIKAILMAINKKSLAKAAEELSYTPSALSHMADSLEEELGVRILNRTPSGIELTDEGRMLQGELEAVVAAEKSLMSAAKRIARSEKRELRIGTYSSIAGHILPDALHAFGKMHPNVKISIDVGDRLRDWLTDGRADVLLTDTAASADCICIPMLEDPYVAVVPEHLFPHRKVINAEELYRFSYIETNESRISKCFELDRFASVIRLNSADDTSVLAMVKEGLGVSVLPRLTMKGKYPGVRALKLSPEISRTLYAVCEKKPSAGKKSTAEEFAAFIAEYAKKE